MGLELTEAREEFEAREKHTEPKPFHFNASARTARQGPTKKSSFSSMSEKMSNYLNPGRKDTSSALSKAREDFEKRQGKKTTPKPFTFKFTSARERKATEASLNADVKTDGEKINGFYSKSARAGASVALTEARKAYECRDKKTKPKSFNFHTAPKVALQPKHAYHTDGEKASTFYSHGRKDTSKGLSQARAEYEARTRITTPKPFRLNRMEERAKRRANLKPDPSAPPEAFSYGPMSDLRAPLTPRTPRTPRTPDPALAAYAGLGSAF